MPDVLAAKAPNARWGFFKLLARLAPATQAGALQRAHFGPPPTAADAHKGGRSNAVAQIAAWKSRMHTKVRACTWAASRHAVRAWSCRASLLLAGWDT